MPGIDPREGAEVELAKAPERDDAGDIEIGDSEGIPEQVSVAG
jgi:hypothetical protein